MSKPQDTIAFNFRLLDGSSLRAAIPKKVALENLQIYIKKRTERDFPKTSILHRKIYDSMKYHFQNHMNEKLFPEEDKRPLSEIFSPQDQRLGVTLLVVPDEKNVVNKRETGSIKEKKKEILEQYNASKTLKGDDPDKKREFQQKLRERESEEKRAMNEEKKKILAEVRKKIESDKETIKTKEWVPKKSEAVTEDM